MDDFESPVVKEVIIALLNWLSQYKMPTTF